jgi:Mn2+/Fe2+ NRAMP family transporter
MIVGIVIAVLVVLAVVVVVAVFVTRSKTMKKAGLPKVPASNMPAPGPAITTPVNLGGVFASKRNG